MTNETLRIQMLAGVITESEYKAKLQENKVATKTTKKKPLKEHFIGMGAINSPFMERKKEVYEDAFEHFLDGKYGLNENEEMEETSLYEEELNEDLRSITTRIFDDVKTSTGQEENDEMIALGNAIFTKKGAEIIATAIKFKLKQTDQYPGQDYYATNKKELDAFLSKIPK